MRPRGTIDVRNYPEWVLDHRAPVWWGIVNLIIVLTTFAMLALGSYFYLARDFQQWPPTQSNTYPAEYQPLPDLLWSTATLALLLLSCGPAVVADRAARGLRQRELRPGLVLTLACGLGAIALRVVEFQQLAFRWDDNAYGSIVWAILVLHLLFLYAATVAMALMTIWSCTHQLDEKHAFDVTVVCLYWYWMAVVWIPSYLVVYWSPRFL